MFQSTGMFVVLSAVTLLIGTATAAPAAQPSIVEACTRTVNDYAWYLDHPDTDLSQTAGKFADLFEEDADVILIDDDLAERPYAGRKGFMERYLDNRGHTRFLHVTSNIRVRPTSVNTATGTSYVTISLHAAGGSMKDEGAVTLIEEFRDEYRMTVQGCKFSKRKSMVRWFSINGVIEDPTPE